MHAHAVRKVEFFGQVNGGGEARWTSPANGFTRVYAIRDKLSEQTATANREPPLQEPPQDVFSPQPGHSVQRRRESRQRHELEGVLASGGRHSPERTARLAHGCCARRPGAAWGEPIESCYRNGGGSESGEDVLAQKQYSAGMSVAVHSRTKGLSASAMSPVPDLPLPDKNKKSAAPLVPGARTEFEDRLRQKNQVRGAGGVPRSSK
ncbi:hypothetical protein EDB86DRAFT_2828671 [Lactarius hatsudake]|nr:hypothetical protein EDB86DRAFT_2828671 [Lactarius hatsudake]